MSAQLRVGLIQPQYPAGGSLAEAEATAEWVLGKLQRAACGLAVLPEYGNCAGLTAPAELTHAAAAADGFLAKVASTARRGSMAIAANVLQLVGGRLANVTWLFNPRGESAGKYVKAHLSPFERDALGLAAGDGAIVVACAGLRVGFVTCFDVYFAEYADKLAALCPDVVVFPTYQRSEMGEVIVRQVAGRALDLEAFVIRASYAMGKGAVSGGHSLVAGPDGEILLDVGQDVGFFACEIGPHRKRPRPAAHGLAPLTSRQIVEAHRRPELYRPAGPGMADKGTTAYPHVVAHRGLSGLCPENTLPAFAAAVALGVEEIELDLWASRDGQLVVCHDADVARTSNGRGLIRDLDWADIRKLDAGSGHGQQWAGVPFCRLDEVLECVGGRVVMNIHVKDAGPDGLVIRRSMLLAERLSMLPTIYFAGDRQVLEWANKVAPDVPRCCLEGQANAQELLDNAIRYGCRRLQFCSPHFTPIDLARAHASGMICNLFFGDRPDTSDEALRACELGFDAVLTNWANLILPALRCLRPDSQPAPKPRAAPPLTAD